MSEAVPKITVNGDTFECHVAPTQMPTVERILRGTTAGDESIDALPVPCSPLWLAGVVRLIRLYRRKVAPALGNRCVFEPSCSHYAEMAFRTRGFLRGIGLTIRRLFRCRPGAGGIDWP